MLYMEQKLKGTCSAQSFPLIIISSCVLLYSLSLFLPLLHWAPFFFLGINGHVPCLRALLLTDHSDKNAFPQIFLQLPPFLLAFAPNQLLNETYYLKLQTAPSQTSFPLHPQSWFFLYSQHCIITSYARTTQCVVLRPAMSASPGNLLEIQILRVHPRPAESELPGWSTGICVFISLPDSYVW